ncbi:MAG TPA: YciI family protein [Terriglobales bacterium]|nr:YciI family protein [Terriglobales bacterium]
METNSAENQQPELSLLNLNNLGGKTMRVMVIIKADKNSEAGIQSTEQTREMFAAMGKFNEQLVKAGVVLAMDGLQPSAKGKRVRFSGQERTVTDGPFTETKELVAGFWLWQVKSIEEAVEWLKRAPFDGGTEVEVRPVYEVADIPADVITPEHAARMRAVRDELQKKAAKP